MFEIVFLGTSASAPSIYRGLSSAALLAGEDRFLVDCGEGTQRQILRSGIGYKRLNKILLTHSHLDHILGIGGLVSTYTRWESLDELHIWGSTSTLERVHSLIFDVVLRDQNPPIPIHLHTVEAGVIYTGKNFTVSAFPVIHRGRGCFGYVFQENTRRAFLEDQAQALGVPFGKERSLLVKGESITLEDGRVIHPDDVLSAPQAGTKVVFTGDIARTDKLHEVVRDADVLVSEATFLETERREADAFGHITAQQAATLAHENGVRGLLLTHLSRRYSERDVLAEARQVYPAVHVVRDLEHYEVKRGQGVVKREMQRPSVSAPTEIPAEEDAQEN
jgi:ribonuclease Z